MNPSHNVYKLRNTGYQLLRSNGMGIKQIAREVGVSIPLLNYCDKFNTVDGIFFFQSVMRTVQIKIDEMVLRELKNINLSKNSC